MPIRYEIWMKELRRHRRLAYSGPLQVSWEERGQRRYIRGKCSNVSEGGLRLEVPVPIPLGTTVLLSAERIKISGAARVRNSRRFGARYLIGVELAQTLGTEMLEAEIVRVNALV